MTDELAKRIVSSLKVAGINFVTYLPETRLSQIIPLLRDDPDLELIAVSSEQEAVTIAAGATLGGKQAAVYMENTGIYVSSYSLLTVGKQLGVPVLLIVGYLGGVPDQRNSFLYATIGKHTIPVLQGMGIDYMLLEDGVNLEGQNPTTPCAGRTLYARLSRCCSPGSFPYDPPRMSGAAGRANDQPAGGDFAKRPTHRVVASVEARRQPARRHDGLRRRCGHRIGAGVAAPKGDCLDSDGSVLLSLFNLATLGNLRPKNLVVYVFDNGVYSGSRISYPTATSGNTDLAAMARGAGIVNAHTIRDIDEFKQRGIDALTQNELAFFVCKVEESLLHREIPRPNTDLAENKYTFVRYLERTEEKTIPFVGRG